MKTQHALRLLLVVGAVTLSFTAASFGRHGSVQAQQAPQAALPSTKVELLFVQNAVSGSFDGKTMTLRGVGPTLYFSDRPERVTGQVRTSEFVDRWDKGADNFAQNPPNAALSIMGAKAVESVVVELTGPSLKGNTLSYRVKVLRGKLPPSFKETSLFIDVLGRWRMVAMGMAVGETRGMEMGEAAAAARGHDGRPGRGRGEAQGTQIAPQPGPDHPESVPGGFPETPQPDRGVTPTRTHKLVLQGVSPATIVFSDPSPLAASPNR